MRRILGMLLIALLGGYLFFHTLMEIWGVAERLYSWRTRPRGGRTSLDRGITPRVHVPSTNPIIFGRIQTKPMSRLTLVR